MTSGQGSRRQTAQQAASALQIDRSRLHFLQQVHSARTVEVWRPTSERPQADGAILTRPEIFQVIRTADCLPILVISPRTGTVGCFHAGWRGTCQRLVEKGVRKLLDYSGTSPEELVAAIGPGIRRCCYAVGDEVLERFHQSGQHTFNGRFLDLVEANRQQLKQQGVSRILDAEICTACRTDICYSYRKERTGERMLTVAGFRKAE